jgi:ferredoxin/flavodoxin
MNTVLILFYSAKGNTRRALGIVAEGLVAAGFTPDWHDLADGLPELGGAAPGDLILVGFPALGFSAPQPVIKALRALPRLDGLRAALLCACGSTWNQGKAVRGWAGTAVPEVARILASNGLEVIASTELSYPENWRQVSRPATGEARESLVAVGDTDARAFAHALSRSLEGDGRPRLLRGHLVRLFMPLVARLFRAFGRRCLARLFVADLDCTGCGICAKACPAKAIRMEAGQPSWSTACSACNRCINACPAGAIQSSTLRLALVGIANLAVFFLSFPAGGLIVATFERNLGGNLPRLIAGVLEVAVAFALYSAFTFLQVGPLDAILRFIERRPAMRKIFAHSFTKSFPRYLAPGFEPTARGRKG